MSTLQPLSRFSRQMSLPEEEARPTVGPHRRFNRGEQQGLISRVDQASDTLRVVERAEVAFRNAHQGKDPVEHEHTRELRRCVDEMHGACTQLVRRDLEMFETFNESSKDKYFIDSNGITYFQPDDGGLSQLCSSGLTPDIYKGFEIGKKMTLLDPSTGERRPSTILFFKKHQGQITFERNSDQPSSSISPLVSAYRYLMQEKEQDRVERQKEFLRNILDKLQKSRVQRNYKSVRLLDTQDSRREYGFLENSIIETDAVVLLYMRIDEIVPDSRVEEVFDDLPFPSHDGQRGLSESPVETTASAEQFQHFAKAHTKNRGCGICTLIQKIGASVANLFKTIRRFGEALFSRSSTPCITN